MVQTSGWSKDHKRPRTSSQRALSHGLIFILHSRTIHVALIHGKDVLILMTLNNLAISDTVCIMYLMNVCVITLIKIFYSLLSSRFQHKFALVWKPVLYTPVDENFPINRTPTPSAEAVLSSCMRTTMGELQGSRWSQAQRRREWRSSIGVCILTHVAVWTWNFQIS